MSRTCLYCDEPLVGKRFNAMYCSREHKTRAAAKRQRGRMTPADRERYNEARRVPERARRANSWRPGETTKPCGRCGQIKNVAEFRWTRARDSYSSWCRPCHAQYAKISKRRKLGLSEDAELPMGRPAPEGATRADQKGYVLVKASEHHRADRFGWTYEHVLVAEQKYGIDITRDFTVHHKNAKRDDNRPENLELRLGTHGRGGDYLDTILASPEARTAAAALLRSYGWTVTPPDLTP